MPEHDLTPESIFMNRREVLQSMGWVGAFSTSLLYGCAPGSAEVTNAHPEKNLTPLEKKEAGLRMKRKKPPQAKAQVERDVWSTYNPRVIRCKS